MLEIINPLSHPNWDQELSQFPDHSIFHTTHWLRTLHESYGYTPCFFVKRENHSMIAAYPMMEVNSRITGKRGVALPFTDFCQPLPAQPLQEDLDFKHIADYGKKQSWNYIETRGWDIPFVDKNCGCTCFEHILDLTRDEKTILQNMRSSTRRNIKKADGSGVSVTIETSYEALRSFYHINCITRKNHGLPPQPYSFFRLLHKHTIEKQAGFIALGNVNNTPAAGAVFLLAGTRAWYKYGASNKQYRHLRINNSVMWHAIQYLLHKQYTALSFGLTLPDNKGLLQYKDGWGATVHTRSYQRIEPRSLKQRNYTRTDSNRYNHVFSRLPLPLSRLMSNVLYRHVA